MLSPSTTRSNYDRGGLTFKVHVPDEVDFKLEIEFEDDEHELEIELKW
jgi:amphi-Trp domain-containing protein